MTQANVNFHVRSVKNLANLVDWSAVVVKCEVECVCVKCEGQCVCVKCEGQRVCEV
jgi:hypothetical protein